MVRIPLPHKEMQESLVIPVPSVLFIEGNGAIKVAYGFLVSL